MPRFGLVATGGTFDIIHKGHLSLLGKAFEISSHVIIGLTSDDYVARHSKQRIINYSKRHKSLKLVIEKNFPNSSYEISKLENDFGPAVIEGKVEALVVSEETRDKGTVLNELRSKRNLPPVQIIVVPMVLAKDGIKISATRIKNSEIDSDGNLN